MGYSGRKTANVDEIHEKVKKTALGTEKDLEIKFLTGSIQLIKFAKDNKLKLVAIEQNKHSVDINHWRPENNSVLVLGNELQGCSLKVLKAADEIVEIPRRGKKVSLNVTVAAGIIIAKCK